MKRKKPKIDLFNALVILALGALAVWVLVLLGRSPVGLVFPSAGAAEPPKYTEVWVAIPKEYIWDTGIKLVPKTDYLYTQISYGPCSDDAEILVTQQGGTNIWAGEWQGKILYVPRGQEFCAVATVIGKDRLPIGRSNVARFSTAHVDKLGPPKLRF